MVGEQDQLENGRCQVGAVAIGVIALEVAQEVLVQDIIPVLNIGPAVKDQRFGCRLMRPESMSVGNKKYHFEQILTSQSFFGTSSNSLPGAGSNRECRIILGEDVFLPIDDCCQYALLNLEELVLHKVYVPVAPSPTPFSFCV